MRYYRNTVNDYKVLPKLRLPVALVSYIALRTAASVGLLHCVRYGARCIDFVVLCTVLHQVYCTAFLTSPDRQHYGVCMHMGAGMDDEEEGGYYADYGSGALGSPSVREHKGHKREVCVAPYRRTSLRTVPDAVPRFNITYLGNKWTRKFRAYKIDAIAEVLLHPPCARPPTPVTLRFEVNGEPSVLVACFISYTATRAKGDTYVLSSWLHVPFYGRGTALAGIRWVHGGFSVASINTKHPVPPTLAVKEIASQTWQRMSAHVMAQLLPTGQPSLPEELLSASSISRMLAALDEIEGVDKGWQEACRLWAGTAITPPGLSSGEPLRAHQRGIISSLHPVVCAVSALCCSEAWAYGLVGSAASSSAAGVSIISSLHHPLPPCL